MLLIVLATRCVPKCNKKVLPKVGKKSQADTPTNPIMATAKATVTY